MKDFISANCFANNALPMLCSGQLRISRIIALFFYLHGKQPGLFVLSDMFAPVEAAWLLILLLAGLMTSIASKVSNDFSKCSQYSSLLKRQLSQNIKDMLTGFDQERCCNLIQHRNIHSLRPGKYSPAIKRVRLFFMMVVYMPDIRI